jgi:hypothetical protein
MNESFKEGENIKGNQFARCIQLYPLQHIAQIHNFRPIEKCKHPAHKTRRVKNPSGSSSSSFFMLSTRTQAKKGDGGFGRQSGLSAAACVYERDPGSEILYAQR